MQDRRERLRKLVVVQEKLQRLHETRHAGYVAAAAKERAEANELANSFDAEGSMASLFPELYHSRISAALAKEQANLRLAEVEAQHVATATARTNMVERAWKDAAREDERAKAERDRLELLGRKPSAE
ncbi:hypothetical protein KEU06_17220 [Pseudaminobacter sp. 19-2017]|uniref:Flagellar FliJ protein n=1 Tax=Pseudaminobacter soli (ex Zhang et al. 2022) TaxID=2831468 RepID=A0A942I3S6_9HYPH|nr:hypothetical protein [Pseudaminobacter soli]